MGPVIPLVIGFGAGAAAGALTVFLNLRPRLAEKEAARQQVVALHAQARALRHDLRGILSPALLSADRLANSQDPASRKAADIVIRSVERATARMADSASAQDASNSPLE